MESHRRSQLKSSIAATAVSLIKHVEHFIDLAEFPNKWSISSWNRSLVSRNRSAIDTEMSMIDIFGAGESMFGRTRVHVNGGERLIRSRPRQI